MLRLAADQRYQPLDAPSGRPLCPFGQGLTPRPSVPPLLVSHVYVGSLHSTYGI